MQTSNVHVYAAGDATEFCGIVEGLWGAAIEQGKVAGTNMTDNLITYQRAVPITLFTAFGMPLFSIGVITEQHCDTSLTHTDGALYTRIFIKNGVIAGVISFEGAAASLPYKSAIEQQINLDGIDLGHSSIEDIMTEVSKRSLK
ncbi:NADH-rubredoxin oxidoreductase [compost metagenome]